MKLWRTDQLPHKTAAAHLTCSLPSVGWVSWTDLSIPLSLSKPGNERPWQARGSCGVHTFLFLSSHTLKTTAAWSSFFFPLKKKKKLHALSSHIHQQQCLVSNWKASCYNGKQCCFPCGEKMRFFYIQCCRHTVSCCWIHNPLTHRRWA